MSIKVAAQVTVVTDAQAQNFSSIAAAKEYEEIRIQAGIRRTQACDEVSVHR